MAAESILRYSAVPSRPGTGITWPGANKGTTAQVFSESGHILREYRSFSHTSIPKDDLFFLSGRIMMCSNPLGMPFSRNDLMLASEFCLSELRTEGTSRSYSLKPKSGSWPDPEVLGRRYDEIRSAKEFAALITAIKYSPDFLSKSLDHERDIYRIRRDLICQKLAKEFGLEYRKIACYENFL